MKRSYQREVILEYLKTRTDHPTADKVYAAVRETIPNISLGTVYRNLSQLSDNGMILRITCDTKEYHFDATPIRIHIFSAGNAAESLIFRFIPCRI